MPSTTSLGIPYPVPSDAPDVPGAVQGVAAWLDSYLTNRNVGRQVARSTTFSVTDSTTTTIASWDLGTLFTVGGLSYAAGIFTVPTGGDGLYRWSLTVDWPATTATHSRQQLVLINGVERSTHEGKDSRSYNGTVGGIPISSGGDLKLSAADTVQAALWQSTGGTLTGLTPRVFSLVRVA